MLQRVVSQITVHPEELVIAIHATALWEAHGTVLEDDTENDSVLIQVPVVLKRCGMAVRLIVRATGQSERRPDPNLIGLIAKADDWFAKLSSGQRDSVAAIAQEEQVSSSYVSRLIQLAFLAPDIVHLIHRAEQPVELNARQLIRMVPLLLAWAEQRKVLGLTG